MFNLFDEVTSGFLSFIFFVSVVIVLFLIVFLCFCSSCAAQSTFHNKDSIVIDILQSYIETKNPYITKEVRVDIAIQIVKQCCETNMDIKLITALIEMESSFYPEAISPKGAKGLMQIYTLQCNNIPINERRLFEISYNIECGICILKQKIRENNDNYYEAIKAYNGKGEEAKLFATKVYCTVKEIIHYIVKYIIKKNISE